MGVQCVYIKVEKNSKIIAYTKLQQKTQSHSNETLNWLKKECTVTLNIPITCIKSNSNRKAENTL